MTDKSAGPYKLEQVRKTENTNEWFYRVVGPDGFLKIGNLPELNQYFIDLNVAYAAGFKAGLERAHFILQREAAGAVASEDGENVAMLLLGGVWEELEKL